MKGKLIITAIAAIVGGVGSGLYLYRKRHHDKEEYNSFGIDSDEYTREGYDKDGYNKLGFDVDGFQRDTQRDKNGFDRNGRDQDGFDKSGKDRYGYYRNGYNANGTDRSGFSANYYNEKCSEMKKRLQKAQFQMKNEEFEYALHDIRIGLEIGMKCVIAHWVSENEITGELDRDITTCKLKELLPRDFIEKLYDAKNHCNPLQHDSGIEKEYGQVYFSYKILEELCETVEQYI